jgi:Protein of unknown function (DUF1552)
MKSPARMSRRTLLKGVGASLALPLLEAMCGQAPGQDPPAPMRLVFVYAPNGKHMPDWTPSTVGVDYALPSLLAPLRPFREDLLVLSGLAQPAADANGDGPGDHARAMATFLTGCRARRTGGSDIRVGVSVDQVAAAALGRATRFASLEIGCEGGRTAGVCDNGYSCAYQTNLSWQSPTTPMPKEVNPRLLFERLFGRTVEDHGADARRQRERRSVLDFVAEDARHLSGQVGATDRRRIDEYLTGVRELEQRIQRVQPAVVVGSSRLVRPTGIPQDFREHARLLSDLLVVAFEADLTRVVTFVLGNDGSNRSYREVDVADGHHDLSHHGGDATKHQKLRRINRLHVEQFAYLLERLRSVREGAGTLLDRSLVVYGSGISDGDRHSHNDLPILLAGRGCGTIGPGRHVRYPDGTPLTNLHVSLLDRLGVTVNVFGNSTGRLAFLR